MERNWEYLTTSLSHEDPLYEKKSSQNCVLNNSNNSKNSYNIIDASLMLFLAFRHGENTPGAIKIICDTFWTIFNLPPAPPPPPPPHCDVTIF